MRLTSFTDYCLRVLIYVAAAPTKRATIAEVAATYGISAHHLTKVVHFLGRAGYLANVRGRGGGLALGMPANEMNVGAIVRLAEGAAIPSECFGTSNDCILTRVCRLRGVLDEAVRAFDAALDRYTLADLVADPKPLGRVLLRHHPARGVHA
jgi:Rrf2 family nitric oxide-sensitive transcriptional repressor